MYICPNCKTPYDDPRQERWSEDLTGEGMYEPCAVNHCPICGFAADLAADRAELCGCGEWRRADEACCPACMKDLRDRYSSFAEPLSAGQAESLYDAMDGLGVKELLMKWRNI